MNTRNAPRNIFYKHYHQSTVYISRMDGPGNHQVSQQATKAGFQYLPLLTKYSSNVRLPLSSDTTLSIFFKLWKYTKDDELPDNAKEKKIIRNSLWLFCHLPWNNEQILKTTGDKWQDSVWPTQRAAQDFIMDQSVHCEENSSNLLLRSSKRMSTRPPRRRSKRNRHFTENLETWQHGETPRRHN